MSFKTIQSKILLLLVTVFSLLLLISLWQSAVNERDMVARLSIDMANDKTDLFFDGLNTMMLTGTIAQRDVLRNKILMDSNVTEARMIRGEAITKVFGAGNAEQAAADELDFRALAGEDIVQMGRDGNGRLLTMIKPFTASSDFKGTNCLQCHQVAEGTVLGAVRISYSLAQLDREVNSNLFWKGMTIFVMLITAMALIIWFLRRIVVSPLHRIQNTIEIIEQDNDLRHRIDSDANDELGQVTEAFNGLLQHFSDILSKVSDTTSHLNDASSQIFQASSQTASAAESQHAETETVASAISRLEDSSRSVRDNASRVAEQSTEADQQARHGSDTTRNAIEGIKILVSEIENASEVITRLDDHSKGVGAVLDVIKGIAEQTNLLALNAAIEAARAGEQGRGFAVVADEVRTLATRSHESTQEIENIIEQLQIGAREAVSVMNQAKESAEERSAQVFQADEGLKNIAERVAHIMELNNGMVHATKEQTEVTRSVNDNVTQINELSRTTATDAENTANVSQKLVSLAAELNELVARFKF